MRCNRQACLAVGGEQSRTFRPKAVALLVLKATQFAGDASLQGSRTDLQAKRRIER
jgi:hypothetical protein